MKHRPFIQLGVIGFLVGIILPAFLAARAPETSAETSLDRSGQPPVPLPRLPGISVDISGDLPPFSSGRRVGDEGLPPRLKISITLAEPEDLKVTEGDAIKAGQVIADRTRERDRLQSRQRNLQLSLHRLKTATVSPPLSPSPTPAIADLPSQSYLEQQAAVEKAKTVVDQAETAVTLKQQEIDYLSELANLNPLVLEHEEAKLAKLQQTHTAAVRDYQLALGKLGAAKDDRAYREYQHRITLAERIEQQNQASLEYQQQLAAYEQRLRERDFQVTQTQLQLDELDNAIQSLAVVKAPYSGKVRRIKWLGQNPDGSLTAELTLMVRADDGSRPNP